VTARPRRCGIDAVLFDWGKTLITGYVDDGIVEGAARAGLRALGPRPLPPLQQIVDYWRAFDAALPDDLEEVDLLAATGACFADSGSPLADEETAAYVRASERYICAQQEVHPDAHRLLDTLRRVDGLKLGLVSNVRTPPDVLAEVMCDEGFTDRFDVKVYSCVVGRRKPDSSLFLSALESLGTEPVNAAFVGDRAWFDIAGAQRGYDDHPGGLVSPRATSRRSAADVCRRVAARGARHRPQAQ
jgi:HAD superfamily hydrolase (TIGR01549 family)